MITVFIATYNRIDTLQRTVASYRRLKDEHELVIVDNGTDDPDALDLLADLGRSGEVKQVYHLGAIHSMEELTVNYNRALMEDFLTTKADWYAVADADICFEGTDPDALAVYQYIFEETKSAVGPHLRIEKFPYGYPLRSRVLTTEAHYTYRKRMNVVGGVHYFPCQIDTTFVMFPPKRYFPRLHMNTVRVGHPYDVKHLDWYVDFEHPTRENLIYIQNHSHNIGGWGHSWIRSFWMMFQKDREAAFQELASQPLDIVDLDNTRFILSWCYQYGHGTRKNIAESARYLRLAIPGWFKVFWEDEMEWMKMIYEDDFSGLGWEDE